MTWRAMERLDALDGLPLPAARGLHHRPRRVTLQQQDRAALRADRLEDQVHDLVEQLRLRPVLEQLLGRRVQHHQHPVLAAQVVRRGRGLADVRDLAGREDARSLRRGRLLRRLLVIGEGEAVLAQRDHVAVAELALGGHPLAVQERAVLAAQVGQERALAAPADLRVVAREPLVGQEDVAVARAADRDAVLADLDPLARPVRALDGDLGHGTPDSTREPRFRGPAEPATKAVSGGAWGASARSSPCARAPRGPCAWCAG